MNLMQGDNKLKSSRLALTGVTFVAGLSMVVTPTVVDIVSKSSNDFSLTSENIASAAEIDPSKYTVDVEVENNPTSISNRFKMTYKIDINNSDNHIRNGDTIYLGSVPYLESRDGEYREHLSDTGVRVPGNLEFNDEIIGRVNYDREKKVFDFTANENIEKYDSIQLEFDIGISGGGVLYINFDDFENEHVTTDYYIDQPDGSRATHGGLVSIQVDPRTEPINEVINNPRGVADIETYLYYYGSIGKNENSLTGYEFKFNSYFREMREGDYRVSYPFNRWSLERDFTNSTLRNKDFLPHPSTINYVKISHINRPVNTLFESDFNDDLRFLKYNRMQPDNELKLLNDDDMVPSNIRVISSVDDTSPLNFIEVSGDLNFQGDDAYNIVRGSETYNKIRQIEDEINAELHTYIDDDGKFSKKMLEDKLKTYDFYEVFDMSIGDHLHNDKVYVDDELVRDYNVSLSRIDVNMRSSIPRELETMDFRSHVNAQLREESIAYDTRFVPTERKDADEYNKHFVVTEGKDGLKNVLETLENPVDEVIEVGNYQYLEEELPFKTTYIDNPELDEGEERVIQEGKDGVVKKWLRFDVNDKTGALDGESVKEDVIEKVDSVARIIERGVIVEDEECGCQDEIDALKEQLEDAIGNNTDEINALQERLDELQKESDATKDELNKIKEDIESINKENSELSDRVTELEDLDGEKITREEFESHKSELEERFTVIEKDILDVKNELGDFATKDELEETKKELQDGISELETNLNTKLEEHTNRVNELEGQLDSLGQDVVANKGEIDNLKNELTSVKKEISNISDKLVELKENTPTIDDLKAVETTFNNDIDNITYRIDNLEKELSNFVTKDELDEVEQELRDTLDNHEERITQLENRVTELEDEGSLNDENIEKLENEISNLKTVVENLTNELDNLKESSVNKDELDDFKEQVNDNFASIDNRLTNIETQLDDFVTKDELDNEIKELNNRITDEYGKLQGEIDRIDREIGNVKDNVDENSGLIEDLDSKHSALTERVDDLEQLLDVLKDDKVNKDTIDGINNQLEQLQNDINERINNLDVTINNIYTSIEDLENKNIELKEELNTEIGKVHSELERLENVINGMNKIGEGQSSLIEALESRYNELSERLSNLEGISKELNERKLDKDEFEAYRESINNNLTEINNSFRDIELYVAELEDKLNNYVTNDELDETLQDYATIEQLMNEIQKLKEEIQGLKDQLEVIPPTDVDVPEQPADPDVNIDDIPRGDTHIHIEINIDNNNELDGIITNNNNNSTSDKEEVEDDDRNENKGKSENKGDDENKDGGGGDKKNSSKNDKNNESLDDGAKGNNKNKSSNGDGKGNNEPTKDDELEDIDEVEDDENITPLINKDSNNGGKGGGLSPLKDRPNLSKGQVNPVIPNTGIANDKSTTMGIIASVLAMFGLTALFGRRKEKEDN